MSTDRSTETKRTTDHDTTEEWVEARDGHPATVADAGGGESRFVKSVDYEDGAE